MNQALLEAEQLEKSYPAGAGRMRVLRGIDLRIEEGELLGLVGESGCGKSTLVRCLLGLERLEAGRVRLGGVDLQELSPRRIAAELQLVMQDPMAALDPRLTIQRSLLEPLLIQGKLDGAARQQRVATVLGEVGLPEAAAQRYPHQFSGGQRQRIGLARALVSRPRLLLADEPVSSLDLPVQAQVVNLLGDLQRQHGLALLLVSHDLKLVLHLCRRVLVMYLGRIVEESPAGELRDGARHPYTAALLAAVPEPWPGGAEGPPPLSGEPASALSPPPGCPFHPRCPLYQARRNPHCVTRLPTLRECGSGRVACHEA